MNLTDIVSGSGLSRYAEIALVLFLLVFLGIVVRTMAPSRRRELDRASRMPLSDDEPDSPSSPPDGPPSGQA